MAIGFVPGCPDVELDPDLVLLIFLPPLLYGAAFFTSLRDLRRNARPIALLSIGVVLVTMGAVAVVAHEVIGLGWAEAFVLGAIVSPTDAVAPAEIMRRLDAPRRLLTVVEGENLTNDWTALVLYKVAVAAVGQRHLLARRGRASSSSERRRRAADRAGRRPRHPRGPAAHRRPADRDHDLDPVGLRGLPAGRGAGRLRRDRGGHGGRVHGLAHAELTTPLMRLQGVSVWEILTFLLNAVLFLLVGLQLPGVLDDSRGYSAGELLGWGAAGERGGDRRAAAWGFTVPYLLRAIDRRESRSRAARPRRAPGGRLGGHARLGVAGRRAGACPLTRRRRRRRSPSAT